MTTIKAYTDISQSKKLAEILPLESADMHYHYDYDFGELESIPTITEEDDHFILFSNDVRCWSLAALLELIPKHIKQEDGRTYKFHIFNDNGRVIQRWGCSYCAEDFHNRAEYLSDSNLKYPTNIYSDKCKNPIDACYEMILKLNELKIL